MQDETFVFGKLALSKPGDPFAGAQGYDPNECVIEVNVVIGTTKSLGRLLQMSHNPNAHGVFNCIQGASLLAQQK